MASSSAPTGLKHHPDRQAAEAQSAAADAFQHITRAYAVLSNPVSRHAYGRGTAAGQRLQAEVVADRTLGTGDRQFLAMEVAARAKDQLFLMEALPALERTYELSQGTLRIHTGQVVESNVAVAAATCGGGQASGEDGRDGSDQACDLYVETPPGSDGRAVSLCRTHARVHLCTPECESAENACQLRTAALLRHWRADVRDGWQLQHSAPNDAARPSAPYWFNVRVGFSEWAEKTTDADGGNAAAVDAETLPTPLRPPVNVTEPHTCQFDRCGAAGFQHLEGSLYVCRLSSTPHLCTLRQCDCRRALGSDGSTVCWASGRTYAPAAAFLTTEEGRGGEFGAGAGLDIAGNGGLAGISGGAPRNDLADRTLHVLRYRDQRTGELVEQVVERQVGTSLTSAGVHSRDRDSASGALPLSDTEEEVGASGFSSYMDELERQAAHSQQEALRRERRRVKALRRARDDGGALGPRALTAASDSEGDDETAGRGQADDIDNDNGNVSDVSSIVVDERDLPLEVEQQQQQGDFEVEVRGARGPKRSSAAAAAVKEEPPDAPALTASAPAAKRVKPEPAELQPVSVAVTPAFHIGRDGSSVAVAAAPSVSQAAPVAPVPPVVPARTRRAQPNRVQRIVREAVRRERAVAQAMLGVVDARERSRRARYLARGTARVSAAGGDADDSEDGDDEEEDAPDADDSAYAQFVTAALDQPDYVREEELGDYDTLEGLDGGGRAVMDEEQEEEEVMAQETEMQREYMRRVGDDHGEAVDGPGRCMRICYNEHLGEPHGVNEHGGVLRLYNGTVYTVCKYIQPPQTTARARLRHAIGNLWHTLPHPDDVRRHPGGSLAAAAEAAAKSSLERPAVLSAAQRAAQRAAAAAEGRGARPVMLKGGGRIGTRFGRGESARWRSSASAVAGQASGSSASST